MTPALGGVICAMIRIAYLLPKARVHYLGAGQLSPTVREGDNPEVVNLVGHQVRDILPKTVKSALGFGESVRGIEMELLGKGSDVPSVYPRLNAGMARDVFRNQMPARHFEDDPKGARLTRTGSREVLARIQALFELRAP